MSECAGIRSLLVLCVLIFLAGNSPRVFAWGHAGHEYAGAIADRLLTPRAAREVQEILGMPLEIAARWADCVKDVRRRPNGTFKYEPNPRYHKACAVFETPAGVARMENYVSRNWSSCKRAKGQEECHKQYHYADVAIEHDDYKRGYIGTSDHDIVAAIGAAVAVLADKPAPPPLSIKDQKEALLLLAHLVGDLHQPLHIGAVYLDAAGEPFDPDRGDVQVRPTNETRGGNDIHEGRSNLHAEWDAIPRGLKPTKLSAQLLQKAAHLARSAGPMEGWPTNWASDTVHLSREAFQGISYPPASHGWNASFDDRRAYMRQKGRIQTDQLVKAGAHLAQLLNAVWPPG